MPKSEKKSLFVGRYAYDKDFKTYLVSTDKEFISFIESRKYYIHRFDLGGRSLAMYFNTVTGLFIVDLYSKGFYDERQFASYEEALVFFNKIKIKLRET